MHEEINIISRNYDYEIERAYVNNHPEMLSIEKAFRELNITYKIVFT